MEKIEEYLKLYPKQRSDVMAAVYAYGDTETEKILSKAMKNNKKVIFKADLDYLDKLDYKFVTPRIKKI